MREARFKIWDKKRKKWVHKTPVNLLGETILLGEFMRRPDGTHVRLEELNDMEIIQYTGLKDKNKKEIYEGDVVILYNWDEDCWDVLRTVEFSEGSFMVTDIDNSGTCSIQMVELSECRIIGNIYENPELLKAGA